MYLCPETLPVAYIFSSAAPHAYREFPSPLIKSLLSSEKREAETQKRIFYISKYRSPLGWDFIAKLSERVMN